MLARSTVGALVTLLVISSMASAGQPQESDDAARYAEDVGVTYAEATRRLGMQEAAGQLEARLIEAAPDTFAGLWLVYDGDSSPRTIVGSVSRSNTAIDTYLCKYGNATHFDCGYVVSKTYAPSWVPGAAATFMRLYNPGIDLASGTDSGGPIYSLTKAYGTTSGSFGSNNVDSNIYMASNYFTSGMGISLLAP